MGRISKETVNVDIKASFKPPSKIKEIDFKSPKGYRPTKKDNDKANWEHRDKNKTKSTHNLSLANIGQLQAKASKKNKHHQRNCRDSHPTTLINITNFTKKTWIKPKS